MGWDGSGTFSRTKDWTDDRDAGTKILATRHDENDNELRDGILACVTRNGESPMTADLKPNADATYSLGSSPLRWVNLWLSGALKFKQTVFAATLQPASLTADRSLVLPDAAGTLALAVHKVGSFTRDSTVASGTQAISGLGFVPTLLILFANINGSSAASWGFINSTSSLCIFDDNANAAGTYAVSTNRGVYISQVAPAAVTFDWASWDADGFTLDAIKVGSPTGTITVQYLALRV